MGGAGFGDTWEPSVLRGHHLQGQAGQAAGIGAGTTREGPGRLARFRAPDGPKEPARAVHAGTRAEETAGPRPSHQVRPAVSVWLRAPAPADWRCPGARCVHGRVLCVCDVHGRVLPASRAPPSPRRVPWAVGIGNQNVRVFSRSSWLVFLSSVTTACACVRVCDGDRVCAQHQTPRGGRQGRVITDCRPGGRRQVQPRAVGRDPWSQAGSPLGAGSPSPHGPATVAAQAAVHLSALDARAEQLWPQRPQGPPRGAGGLSLGPLRTPPC